MEGARGPTANWWWARVPSRGEEPVAVVFVHTDEHPYRTEVPWPPDAAPPAPEEGAWGTVLLDPLGMPTDIRLATEVFAPKAPPAWFCEVRELTADPPAVNLVAFTGCGVPAGRLLDESGALEAGARSESQLGAVRWWPGTGEIDQIFVHPSWRRRHIATVLLHAAGMLSAVHGWGALWGDGQRTELGEQLRNGRADWRHRAADLTHVSPPMTLGEHFDEVQTQRWING